MPSDKQEHFKDKYIRNRKEAKETYEKRKEYLSTKTLRKENVAGYKWWEDQSLLQKKEDKGNSEEEPDGGIGNFEGSGDLIVPAEPGYRFTSPYGGRWGRQHRGVDIAPATPGNRKTKILAAGDGVVLEARSGVSGFSTWIIIKHNDNLTSLYGHMPKSSMKVKAGQKVKKGQHIAMMGMEGKSTGVHLHFELCKDFGNRSGTTFNPESKISFKGGSGKKAKSRDLFRTASTFNTLSEDNDEKSIEMHDHYELDGDPMTEEAKELNTIHSSTFPYKAVKIKAGKMHSNNYTTRKEFLINRIGWGRTTNYKSYSKLNEKRFIHQTDYDGYEGNMYSPDAKEMFESLLIKTKRDHFEVISGFRFSNKGQLSPHEAGCAIDIRVRGIDDVREIADSAWVLGFRTILIGGDLDAGKGFIHLDIAPKGTEFTYDGVPFYGGPGKWEIK